MSLATTFLLWALFAIGTCEVAEIGVNDFSSALSQLADDKIGFDAVSKAETAMSHLWEDLVGTYKGKVDLAKGIEATSLKYRKVSGEAFVLAQNTQVVADQFVAWVPALLAAIEAGSTEAASAVLGKLAAELKPLAVTFEKYASKHAEIQDEVEGYVTKAAELEQTSEWKASTLGRNSFAHEITAAGFLGGASLSAVAAFAGGPAGYLALTSVTSFGLMCQQTDFGDRHLQLAKDFGKMRGQLLHVHGVLQAQAEKLTTLTNIVERAALSSDFLSTVIANKNMKMLVEAALAEAGARFKAVSEACTSYTSAQRLLKNRVEL